MIDFPRVLWSFQGLFFEPGVLFQFNYHWEGIVHGILPLHFFGTTTCDQYLSLPNMKCANWKIMHFNSSINWSVLDNVY